MPQGLQRVTIVPCVAAERHTSRIVSCRSSLHGRQPIYFRRRRRARLNRHCVLQYPLVDIAPCSPTVGLLAPDLRDSCGLRIPKCCWKSSLAARRPAFARMGLANLDCIGIREAIHGSGGVPLVAVVSRSCWTPISSAIKLALSIFAPRSGRHCLFDRFQLLSPIALPNLSSIPPL